MTERSRDLYDILNVGPTATGREIAHAYRALLRMHHPDIRPDEAVPGAAQGTAGELHEIMDAYAVLSDPVKRAEHDRERQGHLPSQPPEAVPRRPPVPHSPALIIGPVRWESPNTPTTGWLHGGSSELFLPPRRRRTRVEQSTPGWHWVIWRELP
jgi:curved DNA-binding protein CbpA